MEDVQIKIEEKAGWKAHQKLAPSNRTLPINEEKIAARNPRDSAVLCLFYRHANQWYFPLILRASYDGVHSKQVGFPGGAKEITDSSLEATALRETQEELGIKLDSNMQVFALSSLYIPPSNFMVYPFVAKVDHDFTFVKDEVEVEEVLPVKVDDLIQASIEKEQMGEQVNPYFLLNGHKVWGATAMILNEIKEIISVSL